MEPRAEWHEGAGRTLAEIGERGWLRRVRGWFAPTAEETAAGLALGIGDDAAALELPGEGRRLVVTTDALIEGVHFRREWTTPRDLGHKALAVNLSDIAAMGCRPLAAVLSLSVPPRASEAALTAFFMGLRAEARRFGCAIAGGDMTRAPQWALCVTVLGRPWEEPRGGRRGGADAGIARRDAARPGQHLYVTGRLGDSGGGLAALRAAGQGGKAARDERRAAEAARLARRHLRPTPRIAEARHLMTLCSEPPAMLDVSDGLWNDARQLAEASGVSVEIQSMKIPISMTLRRYAGEGALGHALFGGEDYELLFATDASPEALIPRWRREYGLAPLTWIGRVVKARGGEPVRLLDRDGAALELADRTFSHFNGK